MNVTMVIESDDTYSLVLTEAHAAAVQQALQQQLASQQNNAPMFHRRTSMHIQSADTTLSSSSIENVMISTPPPAYQHVQPRPSCSSTGIVASADALQWTARASTNTTTTNQPPPSYHLVRPVDKHTSIIHTLLVQKIPNKISN